MFQWLQQGSNRAANEHFTIQPNLLNVSVFIYKLSGYGLESQCSHLNFRYWACFVQRVPWLSWNHWVYIYSKRVHNMIGTDKELMCLQIVKYHGTIIQPGITCKKIPCYMSNSACRWLLLFLALTLLTVIISLFYLHCYFETLLSNEDRGTKKWWKILAR